MSFGVVLLLAGAALLLAGVLEPTVAAFVMLAGYVVMLSGILRYRPEREQETLAEILARRN